MNTRHSIFFKNSSDMSELADGSMHLVVTSPPYPMIKMWDKLFGFEQDGVNDEKQVRAAYDLMHNYLLPTWKEVYRVLADGGIACINIGDATRKLNGIFRIFPNHARTIELCESIGFVTLPYILWKKPTNKPNAFLGSGFIPTNGYVTLDIEYILIFRKGGPRKFPPGHEPRYMSRFTKKERDAWFSQTWEIKGCRQAGDALARRTAAYPEEIPRRLIRMFSIKRDTVLDPFLGTGTTTKVAMENGRNSIGYEMDKNLKSTILQKVGDAGIEFFE